MKCSKCGFNSFDFLYSCKKCGSPLNPKSEHKSVYKNVPPVVRETELNPIEPSSTTDNNIDMDVYNSEDRAHFSAVENNNTPANIGSKLQFEPSHIGDVTGQSDDSSPNENEFLSSVNLSSEADNVFTNTDRIENPGPEETEQITGVPGDEAVNDNVKTNLSDINIAKEDIGFQPAHSESGLDSDPALFSDNSEELVRSKEYRKRYVPPQEESISYNLAGLPSRAMAFLIDIIIVSTLALITVGIAVYLTNRSVSSISHLKQVLLPLFIILFFLASTYFVFLQGFTGTTVGKMFFGLKLINHSGNTIGFWAAFVRWIGYYISAVFLFFGFIWSLLDADSQTWHDKIAGTYVVKD